MTEPTASNDSPPKQEHEPPGAPRIEPELRCLNCGYTLRGLTEHRCPECGERFDPESLLRLYEGQVTTILRWPDGRRRTLTDVFLEVLLYPCRFAREFPARHDAAEAMAFSACCYGLACGMLALLAGLKARESLMFIPAACAGWICAACLCEIMCAALLAALVKPTQALAGYHFWRGFTHFTGGFTVFTGTFIGVMAWVGEDVAARLVIVIAMIGVFAWWWATLAFMVVERARPGSWLLVAQLGLLLVGLLSVALGGLLGALFSSCCLPSLY